MTRTEINLISTILLTHYNLRGTISRVEVNDEIRSLARKTANGTLTRQHELICARIHTATGRDVIELSKG